MSNTFPKIYIWLLDDGFFSFHVPSFYLLSIYKVVILLTIVVYWKELYCILYIYILPVIEIIYNVFLKMCFFVYFTSFLFIPKCKYFSTENNPQHGPFYSCSNLLLPFFITWNMSDSVWLLFVETVVNKYHVHYNCLRNM